jgi:hypothetical protein
MVEKYRPSKIGVWIENNMVYRSDIGEPRNPYLPKENHTPEEVMKLLSQIQRLGNLGSKPDSGPKVPLDGLLDRLNEIAIERSRFFIQQEEKSP